MTIYQSPVVKGRIRVPRNHTGLTPIAYQFNTEALIPDLVADDVLELFPVPEYTIFLGDSQGLLFQFTDWDTADLMQVTPGISYENETFQVLGAPVLLDSPNVRVNLQPTSIFFDNSNKGKGAARVGVKVNVAATTPATAGEFVKVAGFIFVGDTAINIPEEWDVKA